MSKRDLRLFLNDILEAVEKVERYTKDFSFNDFAENEMVIDAVIRNLEIIGEASRNIPKDICSKYPEIPWKRVIGLRDIVIHGYFTVDLQIIWTIVKERLPGLKSQIMRMLEELGNE
jgi:uncharacterized protein with HEPN domain